MDSSLEEPEPRDSQAGDLRPSKGTVRSDKDQCDVVAFLKRLDRLE